MFHKTLFIAALALAATAPAQAARWSLVDAGTGFGFSSLSANIGGNIVAADGFTDLDAGPGYAGLTGADLGSLTLPGGAADTGYAHTLLVDTLGDSATTALYLGTAHSLGFAASADGTVGDYFATQDVAVSGLQLHILGEAGEAEGTPVNVSLSGMTDVLLDRGLSADHLIGLDLDIRQAGQPDTLLSLSWSGDASAGGLSFASVVGQVLDLTLSLHLQSTQSPRGRPGLHRWRARQRWLSGSPRSSTGQLTVSAVPEPESYAMLLAGLGLSG
ncbi:MAG: hypothetical protein R3E34_08170 [Rhodocyclaceae bacterium]